MHIIIISCFYIFFIIGTAQAGIDKFFQSKCDDCTLTTSPAYEGMFIPGTSYINRISKVIPFKERDKSSISCKKRAIVVNGVPYYTYWQHPNQQEYIFHPMELGRYFYNNGNNPLDVDLNALLQMAIELPGQGLAWYYPPLYHLARMLGPDVTYSSISQGQILSGILHYEMKSGKDFSISKRVFDAIRFDYKYGGVNLSNKALLELPLFRSPPEIILNGWLDPLLHIHDYCLIAKNEQACAMVSENLSFMSKILYQFDDEKREISKYSNLCPYRIKIEDEFREVQHTDKKYHLFHVLYVPKKPYRWMKGIDIQLSTIQQKRKPSPYDNQIIRTSGSKLYAWISSSAFYDTYLISPGTEFSLSMATGLYNPAGTIPGHDGETIHINSTLEHGIYVAKIPGDMLFRGYPTNFSKYGANYYHVHHVVALMLLAHRIKDQKRLSKTLLHWALKWKRYMDNLPNQKGKIFIDCQSMLDSINYQRNIVYFTNFSELLSWANQFSSTK